MSTTPNGRVLMRGLRNRREVAWPNRSGDSPALPNRLLLRRPLPLLIVVILVWMVCLPRLVPTLVLDRGVFVSVGERLLAGDVLYRDVWDNKDPLFYYGVALGRLISPYGDIVLEAAWVILACLAMSHLARWLGCTPSWTLLTGFGMTPLILTGALHLPGYSHLPGIAVTMSALASLSLRRYGTAGALAGVLLFLKLVMAPVLLLLFALAVVLRSDCRYLFRALVWFLAASGVIVLVLQFRGELVPYTQSLLLNVSYSQSSMIDTRWGSFVGHLLRVFTAPALVVAGSIIAVLIWRARAALIERTGGGVPALVIWVWTSAALIGAVAVLAVTGLWPQHNQILLVPALLAGLAFVAGIQRVFSLDGGPMQITGGLLALTVASVLLAGPAPIGYVKSFQGAPALTADLTRVPPEAAALLASGHTGTYARVGQNDDLGSAYGLERFTLVCSHFAQYPFDPPQTLSGVARCLPKAQFIIVSASAAPEAGKTAWNRYVRQVNAILAARYVCRASGSVRICKR